MFIGPKKWGKKLARHGTTAATLPTSIILSNLTKKGAFSNKFEQQKRN